MTLIKMYKYINIRLIYSILALIIWAQIYLSLTTEYDENIAHLILSWLIWLGSLIALIIIAFRRSERLTSNKYFLIIYMLLTNPFTLWFVMEFIMDYYGFHMAT